MQLLDSPAADHGFRRGDKVILCVGNYAGSDGVVTKLVPDPKGRGHDLLIVDLDGSPDRVLTVWVYPEHLRKAT